MIKEDVKFTDSCVFEGMTSISALIKSICCNKSSRKILKILIDEAKINSKKRELGFLRAKSIELEFEIETVCSDEIDKFTVGRSHGGVIAFCTDRKLPALSPDLIKKDGVYFMIEGIEDPYNFGNAVRSLYALGVDGLILGERNWLSAAGVVARSSAGCSELIDIYTTTDSANAIDLFKSIGYKIICAGIRDSVSIYDADLSTPVLIVLGGEKRGISRSILDKADSIVRIEYGNDFSGSLSASASTAIFAYEVQKSKKNVEV